MSYKRESILKQLEPLFEKAKKLDFWFYTPYHQMWFSPEALREEHKNGRFIWGPPNWQLRDPWEQVASTLKELQAAQDKYTSVLKKVAGEKER